MQVYTKRELAKIVELMTQGMEEAGFTGIKIERADMPQASFDALMKDEADEEELPSIADFSSEIVYHRVASDQGSFGLWLQPYPTVDLTGTGVPAQAFMPAGHDPADMPSDWSFVGMDEDIFQLLFGELAKASRKP